MALKKRGAESLPLTEHHGAGSRWRNVHKYALCLHLVGIKNHLGVDATHARVWEVVVY